MSKNAWGIVIATFIATALTILAGINYRSEQGAKNEQEALTELTELTELDNSPREQKPHTSRVEKKSPSITTSKLKEASNTRKKQNHQPNPPNPIIDHHKSEESDAEKLERHRNSPIYTTIATAKTKDQEKEERETAEAKEQKKEWKPEWLQDFHFYSGVVINPQSNDLKGYFKKRLGQNVTVTGNDGFEFCLSKKKRSSSDLGIYFDSWRIDLGGCVINYSSDVDVNVRNLRRQLVKIDVTQITANLNSIWERFPIQPYFGVGIGLAAVKINGNDDSKSSKKASFIVNLKLGAEFIITRRITFIGGVTIPASKKPDTSILAGTVGFKFKFF